MTWRPLGPDQVEIHYGMTESSEDGEEDHDDWDRTDVNTFVIEGDTLTMYQDPRWPTHYTRQAPLTAR